MAAPAYRSSSSQANSVGGTITFIKPVGTVDGDALVLFVTLYDGGTGSCTTPAGWALQGITGVAGGGGDSPTTRLFTKTASGEGASWTFVTSAYSEAIAHAISGAIPAWFDTASYNQGTSNTPTATSITTATADELLVACAMGYGQNTTTLGGMTQRVNALDGVCSTFDIAQAVAGASGNKVGSYGGSNQWNCILLGVQSTSDTGALPPGMGGVVGLTEPNQMANLAAAMR